ncbi:hypothetical protein AK812_SmicGene15857 [Symbiodinium microadriaticum]|uniref:Uncharacterized protein n=1 Tax=Symbiodinium microadriaticum TaxID=2951 RepID=A0A1Q9E1V5_SYMMI|nr:hypothetical protein AK812_SmicGene15857 [Symbiodinium microadriaticum]
MDLCVDSTQRRVLPNLVWASGYRGVLVEFVLGRAFQFGILCQVSFNTLLKLCGERGDTDLARIAIVIVIISIMIVIMHAGIIITIIIIIVIIITITITITIIIDTIIMVMVIITTIILATTIIKNNTVRVNLVFSIFLAKFHRHSIHLDAPSFHNVALTYAKADRGWLRV